MHSTVLLEGPGWIFSERMRSDQSSEQVERVCCRVESSTKTSAAGHSQSAMSPRKGAAELSALCSPRCWAVGDRFILVLERFPSFVSLIAAAGVNYIERRYHLRPTLCALDLAVSMASAAVSPRKYIRLLRSSASLDAQAPWLTSVCIPDIPV